MKLFLALFISAILSISLYAENYSEMSTQELIAIMGYVKSPNEAKYLKELNSRVDSMNKKEQEEYKKNLEKIKSKK